MDNGAIEEAPAVPTIPCELIEDDILAANKDPKPHKSGPRKHPDSFPLAQDELFQSPKRVSKEEPKARVNSIQSLDMDEDILMQNAGKATKSRSSKRRAEPYPRELVDGITSRRAAVDGSYGNRGSVFKTRDTSQKQQMKTLKRFMRTLPSFSSAALTQELYEQEVDTFQMNLCLERDLLVRPLKRDPVATHLKPLSKSSLIVADGIDDPYSVRRSFFNQQRQWRTMRPLDALAGGFYARSPLELSSLEQRNMSGRIYRVASACAKQFGAKMSDTCPSDDAKRETKTEIASRLAYAKFEETGQQIYRQMTQYMNFLAGSKAVTKPKELVSPDKMPSLKSKSHDISEPTSLDKNTRKRTISGSTDRSDTLRKAEGGTSMKTATRDNLSAKAVRAKEKRGLSVMNIPIPGTPSADSNFTNSRPKPADNSNAKEDGELSDNADVIDDIDDIGARDVTESEEPFQIEIHPKKQSENEESSDHDSDAGSKKKKKKRKKAKSSSTKKERKKKKKEKKAKDERSGDDLPKAYALNRNDEDRPQRIFIPRDQNRPFFRRGGFHPPYHNRGGFRNFRYNNNFRFRGRGNFQYNPMNRNYNNRFQRPGGSLYQRLREKRFVSESSSDGESSKRRKRSRSDSGRKSPSVTPKREIIVSEKTRAESVSKSAERKRERKDKGDDSDGEASALTMLNEYV